MTAPNDDAFWKSAMEAVETAEKLKKIMLKRGLLRCRCPCPRCGKTITAGLTDGPRKRLRMACEGQCGMNLME